MLAHTSSDWHNGSVRGADKPRPTTGNPKLVHHARKHDNSECTSTQPHLHPVVASVLRLTTGWRGFKPAIAVEQGSTEGHANHSKDREVRRRDEWPDTIMVRSHGVEEAIDHEAWQRQRPPKINKFSWPTISCKRLWKRGDGETGGGTWRATHQIDSRQRFRAGAATASQRARGFPDIAEAAAPTDANSAHNNGPSPRAHRDPPQLGRSTDRQLSSTAPYSHPNPSETLLVCNV